MALFVGSIVINATDVERASAFWCAALGYVVRDPDPAFTVLTDPERSWPLIGLQLSNEPKRGHNRVHLDLFTGNQEREVARLEALGATRPPWTYPPDADFMVLADPDGNEFCVIQTDHGCDDLGPASAS